VKDLEERCKALRIPCGRSNKTKLIELLVNYSKSPEQWRWAFLVECPGAATHNEFASLICLRYIFSQLSSPQKRPHKGVRESQSPTKRVKTSHARQQAIDAQRLAKGIQESKGSGSDICSWVKKFRVMGAERRILTLVLAGPQSSVLLPERMCPVQALGSFACPLREYKSSVWRIQSGC
jgi:hypothetical protein